jgi:hypothetical protein
MGIGGTDPCDDRGKGLATITWQRLVVSQLRGGRHGDQVADFDLDEDETEVYRASIGSAGAGLPGPYCCYSRCTQLVVARSAPAVIATAGFRVEDRCIPAPSSTSAPGESSACPAALEVDGVLRPYRGPYTNSDVTPWWDQRQ